MRHAEVSARIGQAQRPGGGRTRHLSPYDVRDVGQLVVRRLLQEGGYRVGVGVTDQGLQVARGSSLCDCFRGQRGGRRSGRQGGLRLLAAFSAGRSYNKG